RLSLSRLQAFLWTLVIFGAFASAMAIHTTIRFATQQEKDDAFKAKDTLAATAQALSAEARDARTEYERAQIAFDTSTQAAHSAPPDKISAAEEILKQKLDEYHKATAATNLAEAKLKAALQKQREAEIKASS